VGGGVGLGTTSESKVGKDTRYRREGEKVCDFAGGHLMATMIALKCSDKSSLQKKGEMAATLTTAGGGGHITDQ